MMRCGPWIVHPDICVDAKGYVIAVIGWHGNVCMRQRRLGYEDSIALSNWIQARLYVQSVQRRIDCTTSTKS